ncbi:hypothetical protein C8F01DRAFT_634345 [Mycena amicta]|nr:hypothetical protein C8F01DRAFT_634345 [Mycena amicta]
MQFSVPRKRPCTPVRLWLGVLLFLASLCDKHLPAREIVSSTPGFVTFVMKIWLHLRGAGQLRLPNQQHLLTSLLAHAKFGASTESRPRQQRLAEALDGAGGTHGDLAALIVDYLDAVLVTAPKSSGNTALFLRTVVMAVINLDYSSRPVSQETSYPMRSPLTPSQYPFVRYGGLLTSSLRQIEAIYPTMLNIINYLAAGPQPSKAEGSIVELAVGLLIKLVQRDADLVTAIQAGLIRSLGPIYSATGANEDFDSIFTCLLMPASTSSYLLPMLVQATAQSPAAELADNAKWVAFVGTTAQRMQLLDNFKEASVATWGAKACDNFQCNGIEERADLRRCPCGSVYYCSRACQMADWCGADGHRSVCSTQRRLLLSAFMTPRISFKQRCFLRQLIQTDYLRHFDIICRLQAEFMASSNSEETPLYITHFKYRIGVEITIHGLDSYLASHLHTLSGAEWDDIVLRARRSRGTIALHVLSLTELSSTNMRFVLIPLRRSATAVQRLDELLLMDRARASEVDFSFFGALFDGAVEDLFGIH